MNFEPKTYQTEAIQFALANPKAQLWLEMGLGKTAVAATVVAELMDRLDVTRVLVVAPLRVIELVWPTEFRKWDHVHHVPFRTIRGTAKQRAKMAAEPYFGVELVNYDVLRHLMEPYSKTRQRQWVNEFPWDMVIFDESSKMKAPGTKRFRIMRTVCQRIERVLHLTGSPAPQGLLNLWAPTFLLDQGQRLMPTYPQFRDRWFEADHMGWKYEPRPAADMHIRTRLQDLTVSMRAEDYLDLPEVITRDIAVTLPIQSKRVYQAMEDEMFVHLASGTVDVANGGVLTGKCRQVAQGSLYVDGRTDKWEELHQEKLKALRETLDAANGKPLLVAHQFQFERELLRKWFPSCGFLHGKADTRKVVEMFQAGKWEALFIHPASAGHGLDGLQHATDTLVWLGLPWSYDQYEQTIARLAGGLRRQRNTFVYRILADVGIERDLVEAIARNCRIQDVLKERMAHETHTEERRVS